MTVFNKISIISLIVFFISSLNMTMYAQDVNERELAKLMKQENVPGAQITHVKDGKITSYYLGEKKYQSGDKVTPTTLFQAASMTKVVAAYSMLRLLNKGVFELDTPFVGLLGVRSFKGRSLCERNNSSKVVKPYDGIT